jgi:hypothetical protein
MTINLNPKKKSIISNKIETPTGMRRKKIKKCIS